VHRFYFKKTLCSTLHVKGLPLLGPKSLKHFQVLEDQMSNLNEEKYANDHGCIHYEWD